MYKIGDIIKTNCGNVKVISVNGWRKIDVMFINTGYITTTSSSDLTKGCVKDYLSPTLFGVGILGRKLLPEDKVAYNVWRSMLTRTQQQELYPAYKGVVVDESFLTFTTFKEWFDKNKPNYAEYDLDKDLLGNSKVYSPVTCCILPREINIAIAKKKVGCTGYTGVRRSHDKFYSSVRQGDDKCYLGTFETAKEAALAYKQAKESYIKEVANKWKDQIDPRVYDALIRYEVEITD